MRLSSASRATVEEVRKQLGRIYKFANRDPRKI